VASTAPGISPYGEFTHLRRAGEALHPERSSLEALAGLRAGMGECPFAGQYQQEPVPDGVGLVTHRGLRRDRRKENSPSPASPHGAGLR
jgi:hypothetical protein